MKHFATFTDCDVCHVRALETSTLPYGWKFEARAALQGGASNPMIVCDECAKELEKLRSTLLDRLLELREGLHIGSRWYPANAPAAIFPVCPKEIRDLNNLEALGPAHRALVELKAFPSNDGRIESFTAIVIPSLPPIVPF